MQRLLATSRHVPFIVITAPRGYGKTTVLMQWTVVEPRPLAWVSVDRLDGDPVHLARQIARALDRIAPLDDAVWRALAGHASPGAAVGAMLASLRSWRRPLVLVLDEVEHRPSRQSRQLIQSLAAGFPTGCHVALAATSHTGLDLGRMRSDNLCLELGQDDLAFDIGEAAALFAQLDIDWPEHVLSALVRRAEGWPVGLYLAARALRGRLNRAAPLVWDGGDRYIVDYFRDTVLAAEPADVVRFLLHTAPLEWMSGSLCDAVAGGSGSARLLADLSDRSIFTRPVDRRAQWHRYHPLFRRALLAELRRNEPGEEARLHRRAAAWFEEHRCPGRAIAHALAAGDARTSSRLIAANTRAFVSAGRYRTVVGWLQALGEGTVLGNPHLAVLAAWIWAYAGDVPQAHRALLAARRAPSGDPLPDGSASLESAVSMISSALATLGVEQMLINARRGFDLEPPGSDWHPVAAVLLGVAHLLNGAPHAATKVFRHVILLGRERQRTATMVALAELSLLAAEQGKWVSATTRAVEACEAVAAAGMRDFTPSVLAYAARARAAAHRGDLDIARRYVGEAKALHGRHSPAAFPWLAAQATIALGHACLDLHDVGCARDWAAAAEQHVAALLTEGTLRGWLDRLTARVGPTNAGSTGTPPALSPAEARVLRLLPTHLTLSDIGVELHISRHTVKSHVTAVYRKLGVSSRAQAVQRARDAGLLPG